MHEVDLRFLQAALNRYVKKGFRPLPLDGKNSVQLREDLIAALIFIKLNLAGTDDLRRIEAWESTILLSKNRFGAVADDVLVNNAEELAAFLNENADLAGLPAGQDPTKPPFPKWGYAFIGGVGLVVLLGLFGLSRVQPAMPRE